MCAVFPSPCHARQGWIDCLAWRSQAPTPLPGDRPIPERSRRSSLRESDLAPASTLRTAFQFDLPPQTTVHDTILSDRATTPFWGTVISAERIAASLLGSRPWHEASAAAGSLAHD